MKRIVDLLSQQAIGSDGAVNVRRLERDNDVGEIQIFKDPNMSDRRFDHRFGSRGAVLCQQILLERSAVDADANRHALRLSRAYYFDNSLVASDVSRIEPQLVDARFQRQQRQLVVKMD